MSDALQFLLLLLTFLNTAALGFAAFYWIRKREEAQRAAAGRDPQADLANMMILFQTMRDIVQQQKELARQFNESLDKKVNLIRQAASAASENLDRLREAERRVLAQLEEVQAELAGLQKQASSMRMLGGNGYSASQAHAPGPAAAEERAAEEALAPLLRMTGGPPEDGSGGYDLIDNWVGFDFHNEALGPAPPVEEVPLDLDEAEMTGAQREAIQALLGVGDPQDGKTDGPADSTGGNGKASKEEKGRVEPSPTVHARVYEYRTPA